LALKTEKKLSRKGDERRITYAASFCPLRAFHRKHPNKASCLEKRRGEEEGSGGRRREVTYQPPDRFWDHAIALTHLSQQPTNTERIFITCPKKLKKGGRRE